MIFKVLETGETIHGWTDLAERSPKPCHFPSLVNGKVANGGRENDRGNFGCSAVGIPRARSAHPLEMANENK